MYLYLVRHGESEGNTTMVFHGQKDFPLTDKGRQQARTVGEKLKGKPFTRCCASNLKRAWETAQLCMEASGSGVEPEVCLALREHDVGAFLEGIPWEELRRRYPQVAQGYIYDWFNTQVPGGEPPQVMLERVGRGLEEILHRGEDTVIAGHNVSLNMVLRNLGLQAEAGALQGRAAPYFGQGDYTLVEVKEGKAALLGLNL